ncbi:MAG TPA: MarR family transcriptional regulator [Herpetosiphonaceae bacterium]
MSWNTEKATQELLAVLPLLTRIVAAEVRREAGEETTMPQFRVLSHLTAEPLTMSVLAKKRRVTLQSMSELVQSLVGRGWVARLPDPRDRRQSLLHLTDEGRRHYEQATQYTLRSLVPLMEQLSQAEMDAIRIALPALRRVLTQEEGNTPDER